MIITQIDQLLPKSVRFESGKYSQRKALPNVFLGGRCQGKSEAVRRFLERPQHFFEPSPYIPTEENMNYTFHLPHVDMLRVEAVRRDLSMAKPLAILTRGRMKAFVFSAELKRKAGLLGTRLPLEGNFSQETNAHIKELKLLVQAVRNKPWPQKTETKCHVEIPDL